MIQCPKREKETGRGDVLYSCGVLVAALSPVRFTGMWKTRRLLFLVPVMQTLFRKGSRTSQLSDVNYLVLFWNTKSQTLQYVRSDAVIKIFVTSPGVLTLTSPL